MHKVLKIEIKSGVFLKATKNAYQVIFFPMVKSHSIWPEAETLFYSQNENFHNSVTSAFHRGYRTFTVDPEKSLVPAFFKVSTLYLLHFFLLSSPMLHQLENMGGHGHLQNYTKVSYQSLLMCYMILVMRALRESCSA